jgi:protein O-GlcNAc transferase
MLKKHLIRGFQQFYSYAKSVMRPSAAAEEVFAQAKERMRLGELRGAVAGFRLYLKLNPGNLQALNDLGACLADMGDNAAASAAFELAYQLDETYVPAVINHAKLLIDRKQGQEALPFLRQAMIIAPDFRHSDGIYGSFCMSVGDVPGACKFHKQGWLSDFDNLRFANSYLFSTAYLDFDESQMAAEHSFWADTLKPIEFHQPAEVDKSIRVLGAMPAKGKRIRIGYWSPDFRSHSIRYFFRPLLENHDPSKFEVVLYHDTPIEDAQTGLIGAQAEHIFRVHHLEHTDLYALICSHQLDVLVELAGHTSFNRLSLLQQRFATVQITALGYPPTTGLRSIDAKLLDAHIFTSSSSAYYAESPLVLPTSFWCFDPMEEAPVADEPPHVANGHITFACVGNIAKINTRILGCWKQILDRTPNSRLVLRSISFKDKAATEMMRVRLGEAGIDSGRVACLDAAVESEYAGTYNEVDVVLDTFPFNGGTTTCFAVYMGVPVVSLSGKSLISRMGHSILTNMGKPEFAVQTENEYVAKAVELARNSQAIRAFKRGAREQFQRTALGNGALFAREFETACEKLLNSKHNPYVQNIMPLPAKELVGRAYAAMQSGQPDAAQRILTYCIKHYPDCGSAHLLAAQQLAAKGERLEAIAYLKNQLEYFALADKIGALAGLAHQYLVLGERIKFKETVAELTTSQCLNAFDELLVCLYQAQCEPASNGHLPDTVGKPGKRILVIISTDDLLEFARLQAQFTAVCTLPEGCDIRYERSAEKMRAKAYQEFDSSVADVLLILHKNVTVYQETFLQNVLDALDECDVVGFAGAMRWSRINWRRDAFQKKAAGFLIASSEAENCFELQWFGETTQTLEYGAAVLDGSVMALNAAACTPMLVDDELADGGLLLEETWSHDLYKNGRRVAVHRNLGVLIDRNAVVNAPNHAEAQMHVANKYGFDPVHDHQDDYTVLSTIFNGLEEAQLVMQEFVKS